MHVGQPEVEDDHIGRLSGKRDRLSTAVRRKYLVAELGKEPPIDVLDYVIVFDGENSHALTVCIRRPSGH